MRPWEYEYQPVTTSAPDDDAQGCDVTIATETRVEARAIATAVAALYGDVVVESVLDRAPLFWTRVRAKGPIVRAELAQALASFGVRYVASSLRGAMSLGAPAKWSGATPCKPRDWRARKPSSALEHRTPARWFSSEDGVAIDRPLCGGGAGTRLAVIDDDVLDAELLPLDRVVMVGVERAPGGTFHGTLLTAWAVGTTRSTDDPNVAFRGVAPDASPRIYCIPKPEIDVVSLPLAIVRAVDDGADVVMCTTFVEGATSPMLDDALELASRLGRRGRGAIVVMPSGRQASSPPRSMHASWTLSFADPASDPRVFCVGPSGREGGWFLWKDKRGRFRPFANRGAALRWLAPGDDIVFPFDTRERPFHAESSGATAMAAGVLLLVLANNPTLRRHELDSIVSWACARVPDEARVAGGVLADPHDVLPRTKDADGHDAKSGYGRMHATRGCLAARDPLCATLYEIGECEAACALARSAPRRPWSPGLSRWAARARFADASIDHAMRALARHLRLVAHHRERREAHGGGTVLRQAAVVVRMLQAMADRARPSRRVRAELDALAAWLDGATASSPIARASIGAEAAIFALAEELWPHGDEQRGDDAPRSTPAPRVGGVVVRA